jgi:AAA15 family ATPase/GTPase
LENNAIALKCRDAKELAPLSTFGDGVRRALLIAAAIPSAQNGVLLIDEIESALHVSILDSMLDSLRLAAEKYDVQIFATTHSLETVDAMANAFRGSKDDLVGYKLREGKKGIPNDAYRLSGKAISDMRNMEGYDIR